MGQKNKHTEEASEKCIREHSQLWKEIIKANK